MNLVSRYPITCKKVSSHRRWSVKKGVLKNFAKFTGKHLCQSLFFKNLQASGLHLWDRCFPVNFAKFLRLPFWKNSPRWLFLKVVTPGFDELITTNVWLKVLWLLTMKLSEFWWDINLIINRKTISQRDTISTLFALKIWLFKVESN